MLLNCDSQTLNYKTVISEKDTQRLQSLHQHQVMVSPHSQQLPNQTFLIYTPNLRPRWLTTMTLEFLSGVRGLIQYQERLKWFQEGHLCNDFIDYFGEKRLLLQPMQIKILMKLKYKNMHCQVLIFLRLRSKINRAKNLAIFTLFFLRYFNPGFRRIWVWSRGYLHTNTNTIQWNQWLSSE